MEKITIDYVLGLGFKPIPHFTIGNTHTLDIGRCRQLSLSSIGSGNEIMFINEHDNNDYRIVTDLVCIHNFDYDGFLSKEKLCTIIKALKQVDRNKQLR